MFQTIKLAATSLLLAASALAAQAAPPPADLTVLASRGQLFTLALDGRLLTGSATRQVHVGWLAPGQHWAEVRVFSPYGGPPVAFRTTVWLRPGLDSRYALTTSPYGPGLQSLGAVVAGGYAGRGGYGSPYGGPGYGAPGSYGGAPSPYPAYPQNGAYPVPGAQPGGYAAPAPYGSEPAAPNGGYGQPSPSYGQTVPGYGQPVPDGYGQPGPSPYPAPQGGHPNPGNSYPNATDPNSLSPLPPATVRDLAQELRQQPSDQARLDVARQALDGSALQTSELGELLRTLTTEPARIELIELSYAHLSDPAAIGQLLAQLRPASAGQVERDLGLPHTY